MNLISKIEADLSAAMKSGDSVCTGVLRLLKNSLKNEQIKLGHELSDDEVSKVLAKEAKQRRDSIDAYTKAERPDLVEVEEEERRIIAEYLPQPMDDAELTKLIDQVISDTGAQGLAQMGAVIGAVMSKTAGRAEGATVSQLVKQRLA